jgi:signal transduction histidine kinase
MNLLQNASQAIEGNGTIVIKTESVNNFVKISIKDSGAGISEENKKNLFKAFFTTKEPNVGTGLGLTISQSIIQVHGGTIEFNSKLGEGTEFVISLPSRQE